MTKISVTKKDNNIVELECDGHTDYGVNGEDIVCRVINGGQVLFDGEPAAIFKEHGDELVQVGVDVPQVYKLADLLRHKGISLPEGIKDEMALVKAIKQAKGWK